MVSNATILLTESDVYSIKGSWMKLSNDPKILLAFLAKAFKIIIM